MRTLRTVPMATGMSDVMMSSTTVAGREARAIGAGSAVAEGVKGLVVRGRPSGVALDRLWSGSSPQKSSRISSIIQYFSQLQS